MRKSHIIAAALAALVISGAVMSLALARRSVIAPVDLRPPQSFDAALVKRGRELAAIGNCNDCHTEQNGRNFAGGLPVRTPFGMIRSTNITPDPETGIGRWSEAAFRRAMRSGVDRQGRHLYPTFPYDHFVNVSDDDDRAIYAYLMTREAVHAPPKPNELSFPFDQRALIAGWKLLFLRQGGFRPNASKNAESNRGAYLVEGLAHCGACHTPRNGLGAERRNATFSGGKVDNWSAYAVNGQSPSPVAWDEEALFQYLRYGWHPDHGVAHGPMAQVVSNLSTVPESDVRAVAVYMSDWFGAPRPDRARDRVLTQAGPAPDEQNSSGAKIYAAACATCHETGRQPPYGGVRLSLSSAITSPDPRNLANIVLSGIQPLTGERSPIMPGFAGAMSDEQVSALLDYLRARFSRAPAWSNSGKVVAAARAAQTAYLRTQSPPRNAPAEPDQQDQP